MTTEIEPGIVTADAETLHRFYREALGFERDRVLSLPQGEVHRMRRGAAMLKLFQPIDGAKPQPDGDAPARWSAFTGFGYAALHVDDVAAEFERATAAGADVLIGVTNHRPGASFALIADPEGNVWELLQENEPAP